MTAPRLWLAYAAIFACLGITGGDIATGLEHWPFGSYPMYSTLYPERLSWLSLYGVDDSGEFLLRGDRAFAPFDEARLVMALQRLQQSPGAGHRLDGALRNLMEIYNREHAALRALRLYSSAWALRADSRPGEPDSRSLVAEVKAGALYP